MSLSAVSTDSPSLSGRELAETATVNDPTNMYTDHEKAQEDSTPGRHQAASARHKPSHHRPNGVQPAHDVSSRKSKPFKKTSLRFFFRAFFSCVSSGPLDSDTDEKRVPKSTRASPTPPAKVRLPPKHQSSSAQSPATAHSLQSQTNKLPRAQTKTQTLSVSPLDNSKRSTSKRPQLTRSPSVVLTNNSSTDNNANIDSEAQRQPAEGGGRLDPIDTSVAAGFVPVLPPQTQPPTPSDNTTIIVPPSPASHLLPDDETCGMTSGAVQAPGSTGEETRRVSGVAPTSAPTEMEESIADDDSGSDTDLGHSGGQGGAAMDVEEIVAEDDEEEEEARLIRQGGSGIPIGPDGKPCPLLPEVSSSHQGRKCLVLDMDETLLHGSFKLISHADFVIPVEIDFQWHNIYVIKRPGVEEFLRRMGEIYEVIVFTASVSKYADAVLDKLDIHKAISYRLFRESCYIHKGNYIKDLSRLGRPIDQTIILDNSPASYIFNPSNAVPVSSWFNDPHDTELTDLIAFLSDLSHADDVRGILDGNAWTT